MPDTIIAEWLFIQAKNLQVIGIVSSLLFYASILTAIMVIFRRYKRKNRITHSKR